MANLSARQIKSYIKQTIKLYGCQIENSRDEKMTQVLQIEQSALKLLMRDLEEMESK